MITGVLFLAAGGLALLFFGMREMADGLQNLASHRLKAMLGFFTRNRIIAVFAGAVMTILVQSSSATTVLTVGFVNAGMLSLTQSVGVIMGANIGTTVTAWLVSLFSVLAVLKITKYAMPAIAIGLLLRSFSRRHQGRYVGQFLFGFGLLFLGLSLMKDGFEPLKDSAFVRDVTVQFASHPMFGVLAGIVFTILLQSSSATIAILQLLAMQGQISFDAAIPVLIGDNIGTTITAQLAALGVDNSNAKRTAMAHTLFNCFGAVWALPLISYGIFGRIVDAVTPWEIYPEVVNPKTVASSIAVSHTLFNITNTIVFLPFTTQLAWLATKLAPRGRDADFEGPKFLDRNLLHSPTLGMEAVVRELGHMVDLARQGLHRAVAGVRENKNYLKDVETLEDNVDTLQVEIFRYLNDLSTQGLGVEDTLRLPRIFHAVNDVEKISDFAERLMRLQSRIEAENAPEVMAHFDEVAGLAVEAMDELCATFNAPAEGVIHAKRVLKLSEEIKAVAARLKDEHVDRMVQGNTNVRAEQVLDDAVDYLNSMRAFISNVAEAQLTGKLG